MKKFVLILSIFSVLNLNACAEDKTTNTQEFINPIFYQPLRPLGRTSTLTYITPASIESRAQSDDKVVAMTGKCNLLENKQMFVKLICNIEWNIPEKLSFPTSYKNKIYTYELKEMFLENCLIVEAKDYSISEEEVLAVSHYCITPPRKNSKSD